MAVMKLKYLLVTIWTISLINLSGCSYLYCKSCCGKTPMKDCDMKATGGTSDCTGARWWKVWE